MTSHHRNLSKAEMIMSQTFNNVARHDKTPVKSTLLSRDTNSMSRPTELHLQVSKWGKNRKIVTSLKVDDWDFRKKCQSEK